MKKCNFHTDFLTPDTGFLVGAGSVFNIAGSYFDFAISKTELEADLKALTCDWAMVGEDIEVALKEEGSNASIKSELELCEK